MRFKQAKGASFEKDVITRASVAAAPLAMWVKANIRFSLVIEKIQPLEIELADATAQLAEVCSRVYYDAKRIFCSMQCLQSLYLGAGGYRLFCLFLLESSKAGYEYPRAWNAGQARCGAEARIRSTNSGGGNPSTGMSNGIYNNAS